MANHFRSWIIQGHYVHILTLFIILATGCATFEHPVSSEQWPPPVDVRERLQAGDVLSIKFPYTPELNEEQAIRPDGKIALQLVDETVAAGLTPAELREHLVSQYNHILKNPELTVVVRSYESHRVYVAGEVLRPGMVPIQGQLTVLDAIAQAGGHLNESADLKRVVVMRIRDGVYYTRVVNVSQQVMGPQSESVFLDPYDIVFIPRTTINRLDQWMAQHVDELIPENVVLTFNYSLNQEDNNSEAPQFTFSP